MCGKYIYTTNPNMCAHYNIYINYLYIHVYYALKREQKKLIQNFLL